MSKLSGLHSDKQLMESQKKLQNPQVIQPGIFFFFFLKFVSLRHLGKQSFQTLRRWDHDATTVSTRPAPTFCLEGVDAPMDLL